MATTNFIPSVLSTLSRDGWLLFVTRFALLFAYGSLSVILVFYLIGLGLTEAQAGLILTLTLGGDVIVSLYLTTRADRIGRRRMLIVGSILMAAAGWAFALTSNLLVLVIAGTIGVISPSGNEVGPFLSIEQAALSQIVPAAAPRFEGFCVVHARRFAGDRPGRALWRRFDPSVAAHRGDACAELPGRGVLVCRPRSCASVSVPAPLDIRGSESRFKRAQSLPQVLQIFSELPGREASF